MLKNKFAKQANLTLKRFEQYYEPGDYVIGFITDVHTNGNKHYLHYKYFYDIAKKFNTNLIINGGDIGLGINESDKQAKEIIKKTIKYTNTKIPYLYIKGNHDCGLKPYTTKELYQLLMPKNLDGLKDFSVEKGYGIYEIKKEKIAIIFLNTSEENIPSYSVSQQQINWLIKTLQDTKKSYRVVIVSHLCIDEIGCWKGSKLPKSIDIIQKIIIDFNNHKKGHIKDGTFSYEWDFESKDNKILFELAGDSHFDNYIKRGNLNVVVREGYGGISSDDLPKGAMHYRFSANEGFKNAKNCLFDIICIKKDNKTKIFRIGAGDKKADIEF